MYMTSRPATFGKSVIGGFSRAPRRGDGAKEAGCAVSNYNSFDFFTSNLTTYFIQKFIQNTIFFVVACFINTNSSSDLNLTMFAQIF